MDRFYWSEVEYMLNTLRACTFVVCLSVPLQQAQSDTKINVWWNVSHGEQRLHWDEGIIQRSMVASVCLPTGPGLHACGRNLLKETGLNSHRCFGSFLNLVVIHQPKLALQCNCIALDRADLSVFSTSLLWKAAKKRAITFLFKFYSFWWVFNLKCSCKNRWTLLSHLLYSLKLC